MSEQRLSNRLISYWERLRKEGNMPDFRKFNAASIEDVWSNCMVFKVNPGAAGSTERSFSFHQLGDAIRKLYGEDLVGMTVRPGQKHFKGAIIINRAGELLDEPAPLYDAGQFVNDRNKVVKYRSCLLPFGTEKEGVTHVMAGLSWKEFG